MTAEPTPGRRGPQRGLRVEQILGAALDLLDADGGATPSVRGVARRLGVRPNTLYTYLPDRHALERAIVDHLLGLADPGLLAAGPAAGGTRAPAAGTSWEPIAAYACSLRAVLLERPGAVPLFFSAPMDGPNALEVGERLMEIFTAAGLPPGAASRAVYAVIVQVVGAVALTVADGGGEAQVGAGGEHGGGAALVAARRAAFAGLDAERWPLTVASADTAAQWNSVEQFRWSLRRLLDGCLRER